jgi:transposase
MSNNTEEITEEITEEKPIKVKRKVVFTEARLNQLAEARKKAMEKKASMKLITEQTKQIKDNLFKEKMENIKKINEKIPEKIPEKVPEKVPEKIKKVKKVKKPVTPETSSDESSSSDESEKEIQKSRKKKTYKLSDEYVKKKLYDKMQEDNLKVSWKCLFPNHKLI